MDNLPILSNLKLLSAKSFSLEEFKICRLVTHSHTTTPFDAPGKKPFENTVGKREIARNEQFLLFPQCFLPV